MIQEQARLLAAYHHVGSMRAPHWVKGEVYAYMEWYARQQNHADTCADLDYDRKYWRSGFWVPERGIFWNVDLAMEDSSENDESDMSMDRSNSSELEDR
jgi:hypothetical protein